jgi:hypothetical protein
MLKFTKAKQKFALKRFRRIGLVSLLLMVMGGGYY